MNCVHKTSFISSSFVETRCQLSISNNANTVNKSVDT